MKHININRSDNGFSLVEVLMALAIFMIVGAISLTAFMTLGKGAATTTVNSEMLANARYALDLITRDIRKSSAVVASSTNSIGLRVQETSGQIDVYYACQNNNLTKFTFRGTNIENMLIATGVVNFVSFSFYARDGTSSTTFSNAAMIDVALSIQGSVQSDTYNNILRTRIVMRNKKR